MSCIDFGCGGGDVSLLLGELVGESGSVTGVDLDSEKIRIAENESVEQGIHNVKFIAGNVLEIKLNTLSDVVYTRFLLTHLANQGQLCEKAFHILKPNGVFVTEDIDFRGHFSFPENSAFRRYIDLYTQSSILAKGDPHIGPKLPALLKENNFEIIHTNVIQPAGLSGEVKLIAAITMANIAEAVVKQDLATKQEVEEIVNELYAVAEDPSTYLSMPRIVQVVGRKNQ